MQLRSNSDSLLVSVYGKFLSMQIVPVPEQTWKLRAFYVTDACKPLTVAESRNTT